jgi:hypothetical protein
MSITLNRDLCNGFQCFGLVADVGGITPSVIPESRGFVE